MCGLGRSGAGQRSVAVKVTAFDSPVPGEYMGEQHACERRDTDDSAGPQRSTDSGA